MRRLAIILGALLGALPTGCGTTGDAGGGSDNLPVSGAGPYKELAPSDSITQISPPFVLTDSAGDLDHPCAIADGQHLSMWMTTTRKGVTQIGFAEADELTDGFGSIDALFGATQAWEAGAVAGPAVIEGKGGDPWLMFYGAGGAIGYATSVDGKSWEKQPGPTLTAVAEEGAGLQPPGAVRIGDRVRLYYADQAGTAIWAADAALAELLSGGSVTWVRLDGKPSTPERDPMVAWTAFGVGFGRVFARAAQTPVGRVRHDLYFAVWTMPAGARTAPGFATSFTGDYFQVSAQSIVPRSTDSIRSPTMAPYGAGAVLLYIDKAGVRDAVAAAVSP
jgi:hypothetical protein